MSYGSNVASVQNALQNITSSQFDNIGEVEQKYKDELSKSEEEDQQKTTEGEVIEGLGIPTTIAGVTSYAKGRVVKSLTDAAKEKGKQVAEAVDDLKGKISDKISEVTDKTISQAKDKLEDVGERLSQAKDDVTNTLSQAKDNLITEARNRLDQAASAGQDATAQADAGQDATAQTDAGQDPLGISEEEASTLFEPGQDATTTQDANAQDTTDNQEPQTVGQEDETSGQDAGQETAEEAFDDDDMSSQAARLLGGTADAEDAGEGTALTTFSSNAGEEAGSSVLTDVGEASIADLIPGVGEGLAIVGGAVALGEGLYHIFHHKSAPAPPPPPSVKGFEAPTGLTQKFADAVPSIDTSVDRSGAIGAF